MGWPVCNNTAELEKLHETVAWHGLTFHQLGLYLAAIFAVIALVVSFYLIMMHATHYLRPWEQRHIIRILFLVPLYAAASFLSYVYYTHAVYFEIIRDFYEAIAIVAFFTLLCHYVAQDLHQQKNYFRTIEPRAWVWPLPWLQKCFGGENGWLRTPRSGLTWFNVVWVGVFQYCFIQVFFTCVAALTEPFDLYCENSLDPAFAHIWTIGFEAVAVTIAMYCIIQFYLQLKDDIASHKPLLKVAAIKLVIFLSFWQTLLISLLTSVGVLKAGKRLGSQDINNGLPSLLLCIEMAIFAVFHLWAFSWRPYTVSSKHTLSENVPGYSVSSADYKGGFLGYKALLEAANPWDVLKAIARSGRWLFVGRKTRTLDPSYNRARQGTDGSVNLGLNPVTMQEDTGYKPGKATSLGDEDQELLTHAQSNPAGPPPAYNYNNDPSYDHYLDTSDIGVARSTSGDEESDMRSFDQRSHDGRSQEHSPSSERLPTELGQGNLAMPMPSMPGYRWPSPNRGRDAAGRYAEPYSSRQHQQPPALPGTAVPYPEHGTDGPRHNIRMPYPHVPGSGDEGSGGMF